MSVTEQKTLTIGALDRAHPLSLTDRLREVRFGQLLAGCLPQQLNGVDPAASSYERADVERVGLPDYAKAASILRAKSRAATAGGPGELTVAAYAATPSTGEIAVSPSGDIVVLAADVQRGLELVYIPQRGDVVEFTLPVASGILTIPSTWSGKAILLLEAEATKVSSGVLSGNKIILAPATAVTATTKAALSKDRTKVYFNDATDHVSEARVKLLVQPDADLLDVLGAAPASI